VANWVENELSRIRTQVIPEAQSRVEEQKVQVLRRAVGAIVGRLEALTKAKGLRAAQSFIAELITDFDAVSNELATEQEKYKTETEQKLLNTINNQVAFLRSLQGLWGNIKALGRADEQAMDVALGALREYGKAEIMGVARQAAIELISSEHPIDGHPSLLNQLREWQKQIERAIVRVQDLINKCTSELDSRQQVTPTGSTYTLEQWVIEPKEFDSWLEKLGALNYDENALWEALGSGWEEWLKALEMSPEELLDKLAEKLADTLGDKFKGWDILRVIEDKSKTDERHRIDAILKTVTQVCQPFWSAPRIAPGGVPYQTFMAFTVPTDQTDERFQEVQKALQKLAEEYGYQPEFVHSGFPFALEMVVRVYGARAFYLTSTFRLRQQYEQKRQFPDTAQLLHLDRRFLNLIPTLHEHETRDEG